MKLGKLIVSLMLPVSLMLMALGLSSPVATAAMSKDQEKLMEFMRKHDPKTAQQIDARQASMQPSESAKKALEAALAAEGTVTVVANASGAVLKKEFVDPSSTRLGTAGGGFDVQSGNPWVFYVTFRNVVHSDLYQVELPRFLKDGQARVGKESTTDIYMGGCSVTILSNTGDVFKFKVEGAGHYINTNKEKIPASIAGIVEAKYIGAVPMK